MRRGLIACTCVVAAAATTMITNVGAPAGDVLNEVSEPGLGFSLLFAP